MTIKRSTALIIGFILTIFVATGLQGRGGVAIAQTPDPVKPVIRAEANAKTYEGFAGSYCWAGAGASQCAIVDDPQPPFSIPIKAGDKVTFTVDGGIKSLVTFKATLLDDTNASGDATLADLADSSGVLPTDKLTDGAHRVQVDAIYAPNTDGSQNFVSYVFLLQVGEAGTAVAMLPTSAATTEPTLEATSVVSTPAATPAGTVEAGLTPTIAATQAPTKAATTVATRAATRAATRVATQRATATLPPTKIPTIAPTATPTEVPTVEPTAIVTAEATTVPATVQVASAPTLEPTLPLSDLAPALTLSVGGKSYQPIAVNACLQSASGEQVCINRPVNANAKFVVSAPDSDALVIFGGPRPLSELITLRNSDGTAILSQQSVKPDNLALYTMPAKSGTYVLTVEVQWAKGKATYFFRVLVTG